MASTQDPPILHTHTDIGNTGGFAVGGTVDAIKFTLVIDMHGTVYEKTGVVTGVELIISQHTEADELRYAVAKRIDEVLREHYKSIADVE
jgi:hypothetical protein